MVTSPESSEGKTSTSLWLAASFAETGKRVLIVDADLRRPRVHSSISVPRTDGLSDVLARQIGLESAARSTDIRTLKVLPAGRPIANPAETLMSDRFGEVIEEMRASFDVVVIDSPPCLPLADASIIARRCDSTLLVARSEKTNRDAIAEALHRIASINCKVIGTVLNDFDTNRRYYGKRRGYGYYGSSEYAEDVGS